MQITKKNFEIEFPNIEKAISEADFLSYDLEFSSFLGEKEVHSLPADYIYRCMASAPNKPQILQFGMACFKVVEGNPIKLVCTPMSFKTIPVNSKTFTFTSKSIEFLNETGFDFNKWINEAIPYLTAPEYEEDKQEYERKQALAAERSLKSKHNEMNGNNEHNPGKSSGDKGKDSGSVKTAKGSGNGGKKQNGSAPNKEKKEKGNERATPNNNKKTSGSDQAQDDGEKQNEAENMEDSCGSFISSTSKLIVRCYEENFAAYIDTHREDMMTGLPAIAIPSETSIGDHKTFVDGDLDARVAIPFTDSRYSPKLRMVLRMFSIPAAMKTIKENYQKGVVSEATGFRYEGECPCFGLSFSTVFSERDQKLVSLELFRSEEEVELVSKKRLLSVTPEYKKGFLRIFELFKKYKKPLVLFSGLTDLFLLFREYLIGYDKNMLTEDKSRTPGLEGTPGRGASDSHPPSAPSSPKGKGKKGAASGADGKQKNSNGSDTKSGNKQQPKSSAASAPSKGEQDERKETKQNENTVPPHTKAQEFQIPHTADEYAKLVHQYFSVIVDLKSIFDSPSGFDISTYEVPIDTPKDTALTKEGASPKYRVKAVSGSLEALYKFLTSPNTPPATLGQSRPSSPKETTNIIGGPIDVQIVNKFGEEPTSLGDAYSLHHAHDASYDAYMTGTSFVMFCLRAIEHKKQSDETREEEKESFQLQILPDQLYLFRSIGYYSLINPRAPPKGLGKALLPMLNKISGGKASEMYNLGISETNLTSCLCVVCFAPESLSSPLADNIEFMFRKKAAPFISALRKRNLAYFPWRLNNVIVIRIKEKTKKACSDVNTEAHTPKVEPDFTAVPTPTPTPTPTPSDVEYEPYTFTGNWNTEVQINKVLIGFTQNLVLPSNKGEVQYQIITLQRLRELEIAYLEGSKEASKE